MLSDKYSKDYRQKTKDYSWFLFFDWWKLGSPYHPVLVLYQMYQEILNDGMEQHNCLLFFCIRY